MALLIPGSSSPSKDFDIFMEPLVKELQQLWRVIGQSMLLRVKDLKCVLWFFGAYMIIQHWAHYLGESRKAILPMCTATRILAQEDWRTRYVTLGIIISFQLTIHVEERAEFDGTVENREKLEQFTMRSWSSNWRRLNTLDKESILYLKERKGSGNPDNVGC
jgi:hypothetical protein